MPRMDGFEVTNLVRHHDMHSNLPIIILRHVQVKNTATSVYLGVTHYMGNPRAELLANIEQL